MYYLSIDVANKSLAVSFIYYNKRDIKSNNIKITNLSSLCLFNNQINNIIKYYICEVTDLIPNKKLKQTNITERSRALNAYLKKLIVKINDLISKLKIKKIKLLIELQPSFNDKSKTIFNQIIYEFSSNEIYKIKVMNASYKNLIYFDKTLIHSNFIKKYANNYLANKNHTKYNFLYFLKSFNLMHLIKNIKKKNYDDIADSFMQIMAYVYILKK